MTHLENLVPIRSTEQAKQIVKAARGIPKPGTAFAMRKYCTKTCIYYDRCPAVTVSQSLQADKKGRKPCFIKTKSIEVQNYFKNLFEGGEEGIIKITLDLFFRLLLQTGKDPKSRELIKAIEAALALKKGIYGEKQKVEHSGEVTQIIQAPELRKILKENND